MINAVTAAFVCGFAIFSGVMILFTGRAENMIVGVVILIICPLLLYYYIYFSKIWMGWFKLDSMETRTNLIKYFKFQFFLIVAVVVFFVVVFLLVSSGAFGLNSYER